MTVILLVEDEILIRMSVADALVDAGYHVLEASRATEALDMLSAREHVDMLITDVRMPGGVDGIDLAWEVGRRWPGVALIVTSGHAQPIPGELPEGAAFLAKPYGPTAITAVVAGMLSTRSERRQAADPVVSAIAPMRAATADEALHIVSGDPSAASEREADGEAEA